MGNFVLRASHFLFHPIGPAAVFPLSTPARVKPKMPPRPSGPACPSSCSDLDWLSLTWTEQESDRPCSDLTWISLTQDEREQDDSRDDLVWLGL